jgi:hypothetical protein
MNGPAALVPRSHRIIVPWPLHLLAAFPFAVSLVMPYFTLWFVEAHLEGLGVAGFDQRAFVAQATPMRLGTLALWAASYGVFRVWATHPRWNLRYWTWLAASPWRATQPLPLGPVHLVGQDAVFAGILTALALTVSRADALVPLAAILGGYVVALAVSLGATRQDRETGIMLFLFPGVAFVWGHWWLLLALLALLYVIAIHGLRRSWQRFPWDLHDRLGPAAVPTRQLGWPFDLLNAHEPPKPFSGGLVFLVALLVGLYVFTWLHCQPDPAFWDATGVAYTIGGLGSGVALVRLVVYRFRHAPPLSLWARIVLHRLVIPGYDRMLLAPLTLAATAIAGARLCLWAAVYPPLAAAVMTTLVLTLAVILPPTRRNWQLTGQHRLLPLPHRPNR